ncbi:MAG: hypothetical protein KDA92_19870 [Planctomycetales bacterium]|nr:hypothetical protein [Planctomycetales bacterium]
MPYAPSQVSFNAAFLSEIKEDNQRLQELLSETEIMFRRIPRHRYSVEQKRASVQRLLKLRDQLALHFALENAFGYLVDVIDIAPRLCNRAKAMIAEHDDLFLELCELIDDAEAALYDEGNAASVVNVARDYFRFLQKFYDHEAAENALLLDAFDSDLGVGD